MRPTPTINSSSRLDSFISAGGAFKPTRAMQPVSGATVRTDGRKKAVLAWTVSDHQAGRKPIEKTQIHASETPSHCYLVQGVHSAVSQRLLWFFDDTSSSHNENKWSSRVVVALVFQN